MPLYQSKLYDSYSEAINSPLIDIRLQFDLTTGLVSNSAFDYEKIIYDQDYNNDQSCSFVFLKHLDNVCDIILNNMPDRKYVEIGCGQGVFLEKIEKNQKEIVGFDPSYKGWKKNIEKQYFETENQHNTCNFIMRHVLEHIPNPIKFLEKLYNCCPDGIIYLEVPSLEWVIENNAWFDITGEHCNYFTVDYFKNIFSDIKFIGKTFGGQYISLIASLKSLHQKKYSGFEISFPSDFGPPKSFSNFENDVYIWGAAGKGVIFSNYASRNGLGIKGLIDINKDKVGKRISGTGHLIHDPESVLSKPGETVVLLNNNYFSEIKELCGDKAQIVCM